MRHLFSSSILDKLKKKEEEKSIANSAIYLLKFILYHYHLGSQ